MTSSKREGLIRLLGLIFMSGGAFIGGWIGGILAPTDELGKFPDWWAYAKNSSLILGGSIAAGLYWILYRRYLAKWVSNGTKTY